MIGTGWEGDWERFVISQSVSLFMCAVLLFIHHPSVCVYLVQKQDKAAAQLLFVETLKISPSLAQISLRTLVNTLLVFASRIYQLSLNTRPVNPHTHTHRHTSTLYSWIMWSHLCILFSSEINSNLLQARPPPAAPPPPPLPLLHISLYLLSPLAFTSRVIANLHQLD